MIQKENESLLNVLLIIHSDGASGVEKRFFSLYKHLRLHLPVESAISYTFYFNARYFSDMKMIPQKLQNKKVKIVLFGIKLWKNSRFEYINRILDVVSLGIHLCWRKIIGKNDIVHFVTTSSLKFKYLFFNNKKVTSFYNGGTTRQGIKEKTYRKIFTENYYIDCLSSEISSILINEAKVPTYKIFTSPCSFIDYEGTGYEPKIKKPIVAFVGRLNEQKGVPLLLMAIPRVIEVISDIQFYILGDGPLKTEIRAYINTKNVQKNVMLMYSHNPKEILRKSMIFLSLQKNENYPSQSLLEAMACGNAIIATNVGLTKLLVDETNGIIINDNEHELATAIIDMTMSQNVTLKKGLNSRKRVLKEHTPERFLNYINDLYVKRYTNNL